MFEKLRILDISTRRCCNAVYTTAYSTVPKPRFLFQLHHNHFSRCEFNYTLTRKLKLINHHVQSLDLNNVNPRIQQQFKTCDRQHIESTAMMDRLEATLCEEYKWVTCATENADRHHFSTCKSPLIPQSEAVVGFQRSHLQFSQSAYCLQAPATKGIATHDHESEKAKACKHPLYDAKPDKDGLYHCPFTRTEKCGHKSTKQKCTF
jgi:hypothetical protein